MSGRGEGSAKVTQGLDLGDFYSYGQALSVVL